MTKAGEKILRGAEEALVHAELTAGTLPCACGQTMVLEERLVWWGHGLSNVVVEDVPGFVCEGCGAVYVPAIHRQGLMDFVESRRALAEALIHKPAMLRGPEVRMLRMYLGWTSNECAKKLGVNPTTMLKYETVGGIGKKAERFLRSLAFIEVYKGRGKDESMVAAHSALFYFLDIKGLKARTYGRELLLVLTPSDGLWKWRYAPAVPWPWANRVPVGLQV